MIIDMMYWTRVIKRIIYVIFIVSILYFLFKIAIFYMPFLIAFIISLIIEPVIKFCMKKMNISRKTSSIFIFLIFSFIFIGSITWGIIALFSESSNLLQSLNQYVEKIYSLFQNITNKFDFNKLHVSSDIVKVLQDSTGGLLNSVTNVIRNFLVNLLGFITSMPIILIYIFITIMALYLICVDKVYILDQLEHHLPKKWVNKLVKHIRELTKTLGGYLKAEVFLVVISFFISLVGLYLLKFMKFKIEYPLLMALFIGFVDALPILGSGTVMIPWAIISSLDGDIRLGIAIVILYIIMSIIRQFLEPKFVSKNIGTHPIFTLIAMYTGFKFLGILGMLIGPIILIIVKNVFATFIDEGVFKSILDSQ